MSSPPSASVAWATKLAEPAASDTSTSRATTSPPSCAAARSRRPRSRPQMATRAPSAASALAAARPSPADAAATAARRPDMPRSMAVERTLRAEGESMSIGQDEIDQRYLDAIADADQYPYWY